MTLSVSSSSRPLAVMTGGAGGIGRELIPRLIAEGYDVMALLRRSSSLDDMAGPHLRAVACDLAQTDDLVACAELIGGEVRPVALLVHCAGVICPGDVADIGIDDLSSQIAVNLSAPILLTSRLVGFMPRGGRIIFVNSMAGAMPLKGSSVYSATKFGLRGFALALAMDLRSRGISVSSIFPGAVDTAMLHREMSEGGSALNFVSQPATAVGIATLLMHTIRKPALETFRPWIDGIFAHLCLVQPAILRLCMPVLMFVGQRGQARFRRKYRAQQARPSR